MIHSTMLSLWGLLQHWQQLLFGDYSFAIQSCNIHRPVKKPNSKTINSYFLTCNSENTKFAVLYKKNVYKKMKFKGPNVTENLTKVHI